MSQDSTLIVVHPRAAAGGPSAKLGGQWRLIVDWSGPVVVLDDDSDPAAVRCPQGVTYLAVVEGVIDQMEEIDRIGRIDADEETGEFPSAIEALMDLIPEGGSAVITGAWIESSVGQIEQALRDAGREVEIHHSALGFGDVDPAIVAHIIDEETLDHLPAFFAA
jgi:hypothetical protein